MKNKHKFENIIIWFLIPIGLLFLIFIIPSHVPDESQAHLIRAYEVSKGVFISNKDCTSVIPRDLKDKIIPNVRTYSELADQISTGTDYNDTVEVQNTAASYPFILYMFSSIGFLIARIFGLNILVGCYLAKLMNFIVFLIATYYSIKIIPFGKFVIATIVFMPMFLQQATSTSADAIINIITMVFISFLLYICFKETKITKKESIFLIILGMLLSISKYVYFPIVGISLILIFSKNLNKKQKIILITSVIVLSTICALGYFAFSKTYKGNAYNTYFEENNVNSSEQTRFILTNPNKYLGIIFSTTKTLLSTYIYQMVGISLGWLCINVPRICITLYILTLFISCFIEENKIELNKVSKLLCLVIAGGIAVLILTGMYITWTTVGSNLIDGVQGRYFIPILFLVLLCLCKKENYIKIKNIEYKLPILLCLLNIPAVIAICQYFI